MEKSKCCGKCFGGVSGIWWWCYNRHCPCHTPSVTESEHKCEEDIYGDCYTCGKSMLKTEEVEDWVDDLAKILIKLQNNNQLKMGVIDYQSTLYNFIKKILSSNTERVKKEMINKGEGLKEKYRGESGWEDGVNTITDYQNLIKE